MSRSSVPFLDLLTPHAELEEELVAVFRSALRTAGFIGGPMVEGFEREFAEFTGTRDAIGVGSGTDALRFALIAAGVRPGDTVVTVPNTFIATVAAIAQAGARPDFVDIDERTYSMDPAKLQAYLTNDCMPAPQGPGVINRHTGSRVSAIVPVHLYGQMADMDPILELAKQHDLLVVEDACQAHGAEYFSAAAGQWCKAGTMSHAAAFSFYPGKNLGACGEAGAIVTNDDMVARKCRMLRDHGQSSKYFHDIEGYNGRLDAIQAGILSVKLRRLAEWNEQRRACARSYDELLGGDERVLCPFVPDWSRPVHHLYVVRVPDRGRVINQLAAAGIGTGIHYPIPVHLSGAYKSLGLGAGAFPIAERVSAEIVSLPMFPGLTIDDQRRVAGALFESLGHQAA